MAKYNSNNYYLVAGIKMHPVGSISVTKKNYVGQKTGKSQSVDEYKKEQRL